MKYNFAPMEGITGYNFRNAFHRHFKGIDKYFTPFISPDQNTCFSTREKEDILPEHNEGLPVVPQVMTNKAEFFAKAEKQLREYGYDEVNINLGCPSATVVTKKKGAGFLAYPKELDMFLEEVFSHATGKVSIKTRLGISNPEEFFPLLEIYNKYPLSELIIHPRVQKDFYKNKPHLKMFEKALNASKTEVCYNGDLFKKEQYDWFCNQFNSVEKVMFGRGLLQNPNLINEVCLKEKTSLEEIRQFHDEVYIGYQSIMSGQRNVLYKMKELWAYLSNSFSGDEKFLKQIQKSQKAGDYEAAVNAIFYNEKQVKKE